MRFTLRFSGDTSGLLIPSIASHGLRSIICSWYARFRIWRSLACSLTRVRDLLAVDSPGNARLQGARGSFLLNEDVKVMCDDQKVTDWINSSFSYFESYAGPT